MENAVYNVKKYLVLLLLMGNAYYVLEGIWRGWSNIVMLFVGGLCGLTIGMMNEKIKLKIWQLCLLGTFIILAIEYICGVILNIWLKMNIWNYDGLYANISGQVCLPYAVLWFFLIPAAIWFYELLKYKLYHEEEPEKLITMYIKLIKNE